MENIKEFGEQILRERNLHAQMMNPAEKLSAGLELFEQSTWR